MTLTVFMLLSATPAWLRLDRARRRAFRDEVLAPIFAAHPATTMRFYDAEAFSGRCSDVAVFETADAADYYALVEALRDTAFFSTPYYAVVDIIPALEDGYRAYEAALGSDPAAADQSSQTADT